jgi:hypothetical protein
MALYGSDVTPAATGPLHSLQTAIVNSILPTKTSQRSLALSFHILSYPRTDLDPDIRILVIRAAAFRRFWYKYPHHQRYTLHVLQQYTD